ncbi:MAG: hypothetical protein GY829_01550 [Gammaproteobacteria bacterium]|nr:hypothetical protein [Gammaproteobacteria bacterium]
MVKRKSVQRAKAKARGNDYLLGDKGLHFGPTPSYSPFSVMDKNKIINATFDLMSQTGIAFDPDPSLMDRFRDNGCDVATDGLVKFPIDLIKKSIATAAKSVKLWDRDGINFIMLDNHHTWFSSGMTNIKMYDFDKDEARDSNRQDLATAVLVSDALENIDIACVSCKNVEESTIHGEIDEFLTMAENTTKPILYLCEFTDSLDVVIEMARTIRGSQQTLEDKPYFSHTITPLPLYYAKTHTDQIINAVEAGIPINVGTVTIGGATSPVTIAGCVVHSLATDLSGLVLSQIVREGSFCGCSTDASFMEAATGAIGAPSQTALAEMAMCEIYRTLEIPRMSCDGGFTLARRFNQDAAAEIYANMMQVFYSRPSLCPYMGSIDEGITFSLHCLLFDNEIIGQLRSMWRGIEVSDEMLATDLTKAEGARGNYLAQEHTSKYCRRENWNAKYFGANYPTASGALPDLDLKERIDLDLKQILQNHKPKPLSKELHNQLISITEKFKQTYHEPD